MTLKKCSALISFLLIISLLFSACAGDSGNAGGTESHPEGYIASVDDVPEFTDQPYVVIKNNIPDFTDSDLTTKAYEVYAELDELDRCGTAIASIGTEIMPTEERGAIGQVKPSGWKTVKYDIVDGKYLYNRCHLIGYQLTGENANTQNLITGTRYMNVDGMLPFENMVADYVKETENHVIYRVTPIFDGDNLVARGVQIEAKSVEDNGEGICFNVYVYNNQPGIVINYATGDSKLDDGSGFEMTSSAATDNVKYVLNINSMKFHSTGCSQVDRIKAENRQDYSGAREELIDDGYSPCKSCKP